MKKTITFNQLKSLVKEGLYPNPDPHQVGVSLAFDELYEALTDQQSQTDAANAVESLSWNEGDDEKRREVIEMEVAPYINNLKAKLDTLLAKLGGQGK